MTWFSLLEKNLLPDWLIRIGIRRNCAQRLRDEYAGGPEAQYIRFMNLVELLRHSPIAVETAAANEQHYEVPTEFFQLVLGKHLKYSSGYWKDGGRSLDQSEEEMLHITCERANLKDGQHVLECGCGWGSLSLYMAIQFPNSMITAVSNSATQKGFIDNRAKDLGLKNLTVITTDMNSFEATKTFDRIVSVEMFEHMRNHGLLLEKLSRFLNPQGKLFIHIFTHRDLCYLYEVKDDSDWMAKYFFTGGIMPSDHFMLYLTDHFQIEKHWRVDGTHYSKTSEAWLQKMDAHQSEIMPLLRSTYGSDQATKWWVFWRVFFMSCAELFGYRHGNEWMVSHYLFQKK